MSIIEKFQFDETQRLDVKCKCDSLDTLNQRYLNTTDTAQLKCIQLDFDATPLPESTIETFTTTSQRKCYLEENLDTEWVSALMSALHVRFIAHMNPSEQLLSAQQNIQFEMRDFRVIRKVSDVLSCTFFSFIRA